MARFRKKAEVIEAFQLSDEVWPRWWHTAIRANQVSISAALRTSASQARAERDDWIIRADDGTIRTSKAAAFTEEYEPSP